MRRFFRYGSRTNSHWAELDEGRAFNLTAPPWEDHRRERSDTKFADLSLLAPVMPSKIVLVGLNYHDHVKESKSADKAPDEPVIFLKPLTSLIGPGAPIVRPNGVERVDYEAELALVIGKELYRPTEDEARAAIFGGTCLNDVTARPLQRKDVQWTRAKGFNTFCPVGPYLVTDLDWQSLRVQSLLNGELKQDGNTRDQIFSVVTLVRFIADVMTLYPGDLISTGTPAGVGPVNAGDTIEIRIEGIGSLTNPVEDATSDVHTK
jgi:2-keto-4-pentenoate hydratase/2-oxohepta-3-ene-1,7-dioic acid hydratase in catechol pathway